MYVKATTELSHLNTYQAYQITISVCHIVVQFHFLQLCKQLRMACSKAQEPLRK